MNRKSTISGSVVVSFVFKDQSKSYHTVAGMLSAQAAQCHGWVVPTESGAINVNFRSKKSASQFCRWINEARRKAPFRGHKYDVSVQVAVRGSVQHYTIAECIKWIQTQIKPPPSSLECPGPVPTMSEVSEESSEGSATSSQGKSIKSVSIPLKSVTTPGY